MFAAIRNRYIKEPEGILSRDAKALLNHATKAWLEKLEAHIQIKAMPSI